MGSRSTDESLPGVLKLIGLTQRGAVVAHPHWNAIAQDPDPARQLVWMVEQQLLTYDELDEIQTLGPEPSEPDRIVEQAYAMLAHASNRR